MINWACHHSQRSKKVEGFIPFTYKEICIRLSWNTSSLLILECAVQCTVKKVQLAEFVQLLFCIWWPLSPTSPWCPWGSKSRSSLHLQQSCPHSPQGLSSRSIASLELQTALSPGEGEMVFHHRNRSRARRNHINCKCSAINAKAKMDDNTNANMIYSNLQSKDRLLNRDPIHNYLLILASLLGFHGPPQHPLHCNYRVAHLRHHFFFLGELYHLALHGCSSDLSNHSRFTVQLAT